MAGGLAGDHPLDRMNDPLVHEILDFWLGAPARDVDALLAKFDRWYRSGDSLDAEVRTRFGDAIARAIAGELDHWADDPQGRVALVLLLDQLPRHVYRDTPRAYAGDPKALRLAMDAVASGEIERYDSEARLFLLMPLIHAEDREVQALAVETSAGLVAASPETTRAAWAMGHERARHYRALIDRFCRFPTRNEILGRASTPSEIDWLAEDHSPQ